MKNKNHPSETLPIDNSYQTGLPLLSRGVFYMVGIYKITNPKNGVYIGQSTNIEKRFAQYRCYSCNTQIRLYRSLVKYGVDNHTFEIITQCDITQLNDLERFYQDIYCSTNQYGLNCMLTTTKERVGTYPMTGKKHSPETIDKMRQYSPTEETREKIRTSYKKPTKETYAKVWENRPPMSEETKEKIRMAAIGRFVSEETRAKMSINVKGRKHTEQSKLKMSLSHMGNNKGKVISEKEKENMRIKTGLLVIDIVTGVFFYGVREAAKAYNINRRSLLEMLRNKYHNKTNLILV